VAKPRVHELAKELDPTGKKVTSKVILAWLKDQGEFVKAASSAVEPPVARRVREHFAAQVQEAPADTQVDKPAKTDSQAPKPSKSAPKPGAQGAKPGAAGAQDQAPSPAAKPAAPKPGAGAPKPGAQAAKPSDPTPAPAAAAHRFSKAARRAARTRHLYLSDDGKAETFAYDFKPMPDLRLQSYGGGRHGAPSSARGRARRHPICVKSVCNMRQIAR